MLCQEVGGPGLNLQTPGGSLRLNQLGLYVHYQSHQHRLGNGILSLWQIQSISSDRTGVINWHILNMNTVVLCGWRARGFRTDKRMPMKSCKQKALGRVFSLNKWWPIRNKKEKKQTRKNLPHGCGPDTQLFWVCIVKTKIALKELLTSPCHMLHLCKNHVSREGQEILLHIKFNWLYIYLG